MTARAHEGLYDVVAAEYYDERHVTSRNFDAATRAAVSSMDLRGPRQGLVLDVGCGRGRCTEFLRVPGNRIVQLDNSLIMLNMPGREAALVRVLHDAEELPFPDGQFTCVAAFLCDPFLGLNFLHEAHRVLKLGGLLIGTTPDLSWGVALRDGLGIDRMTTRFLLNDGSTEAIPSALFEPAQLREMLRRVGFDEARIPISRHRLPNDVPSVSPDILGPAANLNIDPHDLDILTVFTARR